MAANATKPTIRFSGFTDAWEKWMWMNTVDVSTNMVDPKTGEYDDLLHVGPANIEPFSGRLLDNVKTVKTDGLISGKFHFSKDDIIYGKIRPELGKHVLAPFEGLASADTYVLNAKNGLDQKFLFTLLPAARFFNYSVAVSMRSGMPKINRDELNSYVFPAPHFQEQKHIGIFFLFIDNLIALYTRGYNKIVNIKKAMLEKMFPKAGEDKPEIRFVGFTGAWEREKLSNLAQSFEYGLNAAAMKFDGYNKYLRITDIDENTHELKSDDLTSPDADLANSDTYKLQESDILFARTGASVGKTYRYKKSDGIVYFAGFLIRFRIKTEYDSEFVFQNTMTDRYNKFIKMASQRSGQPGVNAQEYGEYEILLPDFREQTQIGLFFASLDRLLTLHQRELVKLQNIKRALLEKMFV